MKTAKKILAVLFIAALVVVACFLAQRDSVAKAEFKDGSYFSIKAPEGWCLNNDTLPGWLQMQMSGNSGIKIIEYGSCGLFGVTTPNDVKDGKIIFLAHEFAASEFKTCQGRENADAFFNSVGGKVFYCVGYDPADKKREAVFFNYPVDDKKSLTAIIGKDFYLKQSKNILSLLAYIRYSDKN